MRVEVRSFDVPLTSAFASLGRCACSPAFSFSVARFRWPLLRYLRDVSLLRQLARGRMGPARTRQVPGRDPERPRSALHSAASADNSSGLASKAQVIAEAAAEARA